LQLIRKEKEEIQKKVHIGTAEVDLDLCYSYNNWSCGACIRACPLPGEAMRSGNWEQPIIDPKACIGCGLCERACIRYPHAVRVRKPEKLA
jgi:ferredoxin